MRVYERFKIEELTQACLHKYSHRLCQIFLDAFTTGEYSHNAGKMDPEYTLGILHNILGKEKGFAFAAFDRGIVASPYYPIGFVFGMAAKYDSLIGQTSLGKKYSLGECLYLAELAVDKAHKGRKVGSALVREALNFSKRVKAPLFVRTNERSPGLHDFYQGCGFSKLEDVAVQGENIEKRYFGIGHV